MKKNMEAEIKIEVTWSFSGIGVHTEGSSMQEPHAMWLGVGIRMSRSP